MTTKQTDRTRGFDSRATSSRSGRVPTDDSDIATDERRAVLRAAGSIAVTSLLAGCTGARSPGDDGGDDPASVDEWLSDTGNYDGVVDMMGENSMTVKVGTRGNNGANAFAPAAIEVTPGTTVTWEWVDGYHNVVATGDQFSSGEPEQNATFEHTFEEVGTVYYYCEPHRSMGMKGAIIVSESDNEESQ